VENTIEALDGSGTSQNKKKLTKAKKKRIAKKPAQI